MVVLVVLVFLGVATMITGVPGYVIAQRRGLPRPWVGFVPFLGLWIVLFESNGRSGWLGLLVLIPTIGSLVVLVWTAIETPVRHERSRWWTAALVVPVVNLIAYWAYAFTLAEPAFAEQPLAA
jgi:hypothetical protein